MNFLGAGCVAMCVCKKGHSKAKCDYLTCNVFFFWFLRECKIKRPKVIQHRSHLIGPGVFVPRGELQDSYDLVDFGAHLLEDEPPVPLSLLDAGTSAALGCDKNLYSWGQSVWIEDYGSCRSVNSTQEILNGSVTVSKRTMRQKPKRNGIRIMSNLLWALKFK